jgi:hypothetical protein
MQTFWFSTPTPTHPIVLNPSLDIITKTPMLEAPFPCWEFAGMQKTALIVRHAIIEFEVLPWHLII